MVGWDAICRSVTSQKPIFKHNNMTLSSKAKTTMVMLGHYGVDCSNPWHSSSEWFMVDTHQIKKIKYIKIALFFLNSSLQRGTQWWVTENRLVAVVTARTHYTKYRLYCGSEEISVKSLGFKYLFLSNQSHGLLSIYCMSYLLLF